MGVALLAASEAPADGGGPTKELDVSVVTRGCMIWTPSRLPQYALTSGPVYEVTKASLSSARTVQSGLVVVSNLIAEV